jgi:carbon storage regulator
MLILSRKKSEVIVMSGGCLDLQQVRIVVLEIRNGQVRFGIEAPKDVPVHRLEICKQKQAIQNAVSTTQFTVSDLVSL